jgi:hypothetical protein
MIVALAWPTWADWFHFVLVMLPAVAHDIRRFLQRTMPANQWTERGHETTDGWLVMWN